MSENSVPPKSSFSPTEDPDSFDDDSIDAPTVKPLPILDSSRKRPHQQVLQDVTNEDDSFENDEIGTVPKRAIVGVEEDKGTPTKVVQLPPKRRSPKIQIPKESGIPDFPCLFDDTIQVTLTVIDSEVVDGTLTIRCSNKDESECLVYAQEGWSELLIEKGMRIRLIGAEKWGDTDWLVNDSNGLIIVQPDILVSATSVAQGLFCSRKAILNERFRGGGGTNKAMLMGTIIHELFQTALSLPSSSVSADSLLSQWKQSVVYNTEILVALASFNFSPNSFQHELQPYIEIIVKWINDHVKRSIPFASGNRVERVVDIEENIWMPRLGMKGKVDVTLEMSRKGARPLEPLELKTGKSSGSADHMAQVLIYSMMMSIRNSSPLSSGSLLYLKDGMQKEVVSRATELKGVIRLRNTFAYHSKPLTKALPDPLSDPRMCSKCDHAMACALFQKTEKEEGVVKISDKMTQFADGICGHLSQAHRDYFKKWVRWMYAEWSTSEGRGNKQSNIWRKLPEEREARGQCIAHLTLERVEEVGNHKYLLHFVRSFALPEGVLSRGDYCHVTCGEKYAIASGPVVEIGAHSISIASDRSLSTTAVYHIDKHESLATYAMNLSNIAQFMEEGERVTHLRSMIIDMEAPRPGKISKEMVEVVRPMISQLNREQARAIVKALVVKDYSLIEGLPGSGKTTTIAVLIRCLIAVGHSVLLTAYTHSAVDNLLLKLIPHIPESQMLRLGKESSVKRELSHLTLDAKLKDVEEESRYTTTRDILKNTPLVATTCLSVSSHSLFTWRSFAFCVVDEASLVLECTLLAPLKTSTRFVLVGDAKQLSPLVSNREAKAEGMGISLFERLRIFDQTTVSLTRQYRMNSRIASLSSSLFYNDKLICADGKVGGACLETTGYCSGVSIEDPSFPVFSPTLEHSVVFVDTQSNTNNRYQVKSSSGASSMANPGEAQLIREYCDRFIEMGVSPSSIGVMCAYRRQVEVLKGTIANGQVEVNTIDQYQGRDKSIMLWGLVWTDSHTSTSDLLKDVRRVNVALTRAMHKLVIIGCGQSMNSIDIMKSVIGKIDNVVKL